MWSTSGSAAGVRIAATTSTSVILPPTIRKPAGVFIQALAITTNTAEAAPLAATISPAAMWARRPMRSQP